MRLREMMESHGGSSSDPDVGPQVENGENERAMGAELDFVPSTLYKRENPCQTPSNLAGHSVK